MADEEQLAILKQGADVWNEWLTQYPETKIDLEGADLNGVKLKGAFLYKANLSDSSLVGADLNNARIISAYLQEANLKNADARNTRFNKTQLNGASLRAIISIGTDFSDAILSGTDFSFTVLEDAKFNRAILIDAIFRGAQLINVDLSDSTLGGTIFADTDLSGARGFESIGYSGPCAISVDTLFRTEKRLPDIFLRGCGVPEILIEYLPFMHGKAVEFYSCFISYSHGDQPFARRVYDTLQGRGIRCWLDKKKINPGDVIEDEIAQAIRYSDKTLLLCSQNSLNSWWVDNELDNLFAKERQLQSERGKAYRLLIPLDIDGYLHKNEYVSGKKEQIRKRFAPSFEGWEHDNVIFEREIEGVIKALRTDGGKEPPPKAKL